jgi:Tfp pilus assembly pilus retraction ATPase PilT
MHTIDAAETIGRMIEFFPAIKQQQIRSILAGVLRGVVSQRLLPRKEGGRVAAVEVMVNNARIADLIRENKSEEIHDAIAEGAFFQMQSFEQALIKLVISGDIDREVAANACNEPARLHRRPRAFAEARGRRHHPGRRAAPVRAFRGARGAADAEPPDRPARTDEAHPAGLALAS